MKRFGLFIFALFTCAIAVADTVNINWKNGDTTFAQTTCTTGGDLNVPTTSPTKYGYDFVGWNIRVAKELEYVSFIRGANSYIDTGIKFDSDDIEYEIKFYSGKTYNLVFAAEGTCVNRYGVSNSAGAIDFLGNENRVYFYAGAKSINTIISNIANSNIANKYNGHIKKSTNEFSFTVNDDNPVNGVLSGNITSDKNIRIGDNGTNSTYCKFYGDIYYFKIKKDGVLVLDLIPALDPDGIVCFWDNVSRTFFYSGGADLVAGPLKE